MIVKKLLLATVLGALLAAIMPVAATAAPTGSSSAQGPEPVCNPFAAVLSTWMEVECEELMGLHEAGVGFGVIMKAYSLSQTFTGLDWRDLVARHLGDEGLGWGQIMKAHYVASLLGVSADDLLAERAAGKGWGEILREQGVAPGRPPWAGQGKPPWAQGHGRPSWAGPSDQVE